MAELTGKTILVGVSGGIAAYKMPNLVSMLVQKGADVHVLLTENAKNIIPPLPFEALTGNRCLTSPFERSDPAVNRPGAVYHQPLFRQDGPCTGAEERSGANESRARWPP